MEENSEKNQNDVEEQTLDWKDAKFNEPQSEVEDDLVKQAELIAKLTQEAGFGTPEYLKGTVENVEEHLDEASIENVDNVSDIDFNADVEEVDVHYDEDSEFEIPDYLKGLDSDDNLKENKEEAKEEIKEKVKEEIKEEVKEENKIEITPPKLPPEPEQWEELDEDNGVVKKYIFYVSKDFVPLMDSLNPDQRTAYINDAIQRKIDSEYELTAIERKKKIMAHIIVMILTFFIVTPIVLFVVHKSIMMTFENYKYSQDNFEKLYKKQFQKDRAYMRAIEHNRIYLKDEQKEK